MHEIDERLREVSNSKQSINFLVDTALVTNLHGLTRIWSSRNLFYATNTRSYALMLCLFNSPRKDLCRALKNLNASINSTSRLVSFKLQVKSMMNALSSELDRRPFADRVDI